MARQLRIDPHVLVEGSLMLQPNNEPSNVAGCTSVSAAGEDDGCGVGLMPVPIEVREEERALAGLPACLRDPERERAMREHATISGLEQQEAIQWASARPTDEKDGRAVDLLAEHQSAIPLIVSSLSNKHTFTHATEGDGTR